MSLIHATRLVHPFSLIWSPKQCSVRCTYHNPPRFVVLTTPLLGPNIALSLMFLPQCETKLQLRNTFTKYVFFPPIDPSATNITRHVFGCFCCYCCYHPFSCSWHSWHLCPFSVHTLFKCLGFVVSCDKCPSVGVLLPLMQFVTVNIFKTPHINLYDTTGKCSSTFDSAAFFSYNCSN